MKSHMVGPKYEGYFFFLPFFFQQRVSLDNAICPGTNSVDQAGLELTETHQLRLCLLSGGSKALCYHCQTEGFFLTSFELERTTCFFFFFVYSSLIQCIQTTTSPHSIPPSSPKIHCSSISLQTRAGLSVISLNMA